MPWVLDPDKLKSKCKNTPFDEARLQGRVLRTIVAGRTVFEYAAVMQDGLPFFIAAFTGALAFGYLLGSIPFGLVFTRLAGTQDIRAIGSGNIGATNVLRTGRKGLAAATLLGDLLKGTVAVLVMASAVGPRLRPRRRRSAPSSATSFRSGSASRAARASRPISACCSRSRGRRVIVFGVIWLAVAGATRYSSLASLIACAPSPPSLLVLGRAARSAVPLLAVLTFIMHRGNIARLAGPRARSARKPASPA